MKTGEQAPEAHGAAAAMERMPTGAKLFLILSAALLPLAAIAFFATLQTNRASDLEMRARLNVAAHESARALAIELTGDLTAVRDALATFDAQPDDVPACAKLEGVFAHQTASGARFGVVARDGRLLCGTATPISSSIRIPETGHPAVHLMPEGLSLVTRSTGGSRATVFFPVDLIAAIGAPSGFLTPYGATLLHGSERLILQSLERNGPLDRRETVTIDLPVDGLQFEMLARRAPITSSLVLALLLPFGMWLAAAAIGWFVVDRLLIRPLRNLRTSVGAFRPGEVIDPRQIGAMPAQELRELGNTFHDISRMVQQHESHMAEGLLRQTRLTREVHHRVKNNLQVIASLINFHARGAASQEAVAAYASIQRRVDALAAVHRYHFAELEENRGLELRQVIGELASNIRATAVEGSSPGITLDIEPLLASQDVTVAVAFLITEMIELAMSCVPSPQIRINIKADPADPDRATLRVSSHALVESPELERLQDSRYGRVIGGLVRQLRTKMHYDPLVGAFELSIAVTGRA